MTCNMRHLTNHAIPLHFSASPSLPHTAGTRLNIDMSTLALAHKSAHEKLLTAANATACNYQAYVVVTFM